MTPPATAPTAPTAPTAAITAATVAAMKTVPAVAASAPAAAMHSQLESSAVSAALRALVARQFGDIPQLLALSSAAVTSRYEYLAAAGSQNGLDSSLDHVFQWAGDASGQYLRESWDGTPLHIPLDDDDGGKLEASAAFKVVDAATVEALVLYGRSGGERYACRLLLEVNEQQQQQQHQLEWRYHGTLSISASEFQQYSSSWSVSLARAEQAFESRLAAKAARAAQSRVNGDSNGNNADSDDGDDDGDDDDEGDDYWDTAYATYSQPLESRSKQQDDGDYTSSDAAELRKSSGDTNDDDDGDEDSDYWDRYGGPDVDEPKEQEESDGPVQNGTGGVDLALFSPQDLISRLSEIESKSSVQSSPSQTTDGSDSESMVTPKVTQLVRLDDAPAERPAVSQQAGGGADHVREMMASLAAMAIDVCGVSAEEFVRLAKEAADRHQSLK